MAPWTIEKIAALDRGYVHASNLLKKKNDYNALTPKRKRALDRIIPKYLKYINDNLALIGYSDDIIRDRVKFLNDYYEFLFHNEYDNVFTSQGKLRPTILEEFLFIVFKDVLSETKKIIPDDNDVLKSGSVKAYTNLFFTAQNLKTFIDNPNIGINKKDQDFAIYRPISIKIDDCRSEDINIPIISIEAKTYIDKTMLEGSIATAEKIKLGNPYAKYFIVAEKQEASKEKERK